MNETATLRVLVGDALEQLHTLPNESVQTCITSPPYWGLRKYLPAGHPSSEKELGQEGTPLEYVTHLVSIFHELKRVLRSDGTLWANVGDAYAGSGRGASDHPAAAVKECYVPAPGDVAHFRPDRPAKNLLMIPERFALAMQDDGWILRRKVIWHKPNAMPSSVTDRPSPSYEEIFLFSQRPRYYYDREAIAERAVSGDNGSYFDRGKTALHSNQGKDRRDKQRQLGKRQYVGFNARWNSQEEVPETRNRRDVWSVDFEDDEEPLVWSISTEAYREAHFAVWPKKLAEIMILAGCPEGGTVLDPFAGSGTTLAVANRLGRHAIGIELNSEYVPLIENRCAQTMWVLGERASVLVTASALTPTPPAESAPPLVSGCPVGGRADRP